MNRFRAARTLAALGIAGGLAAVLSGCGVASVPADQVASTIVGQLETQGVTVDDGVVRCPEDLPAEVGRTTRCGFTAGGQPADAVAAVSSVDGKRVNVDVTTEAKPVPPALLERIVTRELREAGLPVERVTCAGPLQPQVGQVQTCTLTGGGRQTALTTTVTGVRDALVNFTFRPS